MFENPPVPAVENVCINASNKGIPPRTKSTTSATVSATYIRYNILAVCLVFGTILSIVGPGTSAFIILRDLLPARGITAITNTSTPIPPTQWVKALQKCIP